MFVLFIRRVEKNFVFNKDIGRRDQGEIILDLIEICFNKLITFDANVDPPISRD
jgi:hypothetical protein